MPQGGKAKRNGDCPVCRGPLMEIWHNDGHGMVELLETHCNQCGYSVDGEGNLRSSPTNEALLTTLRNKEGTPIPFN